MTGIPNAYCIHTVSSKLATLALSLSSSSLAAANLAVAASSSAAAPEASRAGSSFVLANSSASSLLLSSNSTTLALRASSSFSFPANSSFSLPVDELTGLSRALRLAAALEIVDLVVAAEVVTAFFGIGLPAAEGGLGEVAFSRMLLTEERPFKVGLANDGRDLWPESVLDGGGGADFLATRLPTEEVRRSGLVGPPEDGSFLSGVLEMREVGVDVVPIVETLLAVVVGGVTFDPRVGTVPDGLRGTLLTLVAVPTGLAGGLCKPVVGLPVAPVTVTVVVGAVTAGPTGRLALLRRAGFFGACSSR